MRGVARSCSLVLLASLWGSFLVAQQRQIPADSARAQAISTGIPAGVSPGGAFLRSVLLPGWGQASVGAYGRAAFYLMAQGGNGYMLFRTETFLRSAKDRLARREAAVEADLRAGGIVDPDTIEAVLAADEDVDHLRDLVESRSQQREDWIALGIFFVLLGGADAFVSAHLSDFPDPISVEAFAGPGGPSVEAKLTLPWSGPGGRPEPAVDRRARR